MSGVEALDKQSQVASHIGIETYARLKAWAEWVAPELKCEVVLFGSAVRTKEWHDLDIGLLFDYNRYTSIGAVTWGPQAWWIAAAALGMLATSMVGALVEVHIMDSKDMIYPEWQILRLAKPS